jgi:hypothetical protein
VSDLIDDYRKWAAELHAADVPIMPIYALLQPNEFEAAKAEGLIYESQLGPLFMGCVVRIIQPLGTPALTVDEYEAKKRAPSA